MSCNITRGRRKSCKNNLGGIKELYISKYINYQPSDYNADLGIELFSVPTRFFYKFELDGVQTSFSDNMSNSEEGNYFDINLTTSFVKLDTITAQELNALQGGLFHIIAKLNNGKYYFLGFENGMELNSLDVVSGTGLADFQGYNLTFVGKEQYKGMLIWDLETAGIEIITTDLIYVLGNGLNPLGQDNNVLVNLE